MKKHAVIASILVCVMAALLICIISHFINSELKMGTGNEAINHKKISRSPNNIKVGFSIASYQEERWLTDRDAFISKCNELGAEVIVQSANGDEARQYKQCEKLIDQNVDVLVIISQNSENSAAIANKARAKGIPVVA